jgi:hypothetical protein
VSVRRCLAPGCGQRTPRSRCAEHERQHQRDRDAARPERRTTAYRRYMAVAKLAWIAEHGPLCVGYGTQPAHLVVAATLGMDHVVSLASGGDPFGPLVGRCAPCNSRKGTR